LLILTSFLGSSKNRRFNYLTSEDGISQSEVYSFLEDSKGFMWFGTIDGLNRYDGYNIEVFNTKKNDPHSLSNNTIRCLVEDEFGRIWIGTNVGLNVYDSRTELFHQIEIDTLQTRSLQVWSLLVKDGYLLVGSNKGLFRANIKPNNSNKFAVGFHEIKNTDFSGKVIKKLEISRKSGIWVLTGEGNVSKILFQGGNNNPKVIKKLLHDDWRNATDLVEDHYGNIWISFLKKGLIRCNPETGIEKHFNKYGTSFGPASEKCSGITTDKEGNLWVGTNDKGLNFLNASDLNKEEIVFEYIQYRPLFSYSLNSNLIRSLYVSKDNHLWVGTSGSGINILNSNQKKFEHYKFRSELYGSSNSNFVRSVFVDKQNRIWIGTQNNGLFLFNRENEKFEKIGFETQSVYYITTYSGNKNFICTNSGLYLVELIDNSLKVYSHTRNMQFNASAHYIEKSAKDLYWCATVNGLCRTKIINNRIVFDKRITNKTNPAISADNCRVLLFKEKTNEILVGTEGGGLNIITLDNEQNPEKIKIFTKTKDLNSISNNFVRTIIKDSNNNFWVGTYEGLNKLVINDTTGNIDFQSYTIENGLPNNMIQLLVEDNNQHLWIGSNGGLSQFLPEKEKFINYTSSDGIQSNEFSEHAVFKKADGEIIAGGINGINAFYPNEIELSLVKPRTTVTHFYLSNKMVNPMLKVGNRAPLQQSIVNTDSIFLLPNQNDFGFDFSAMIYPNAEKIQYAYMLEGYDQEWQFTDAQNRNAKYTNIKHGTYIFKVKSTNNDGIWEETANEIFIRIKTPFIYTWYAIVIYVSFVILIIVYFSYYSVIRLTTKKSLILEKEHIQKLHELDNLRTKFFINISHDLRTPLTLIKGPLDSLLKSKNVNKNFREKLELIKRNVKRLNYLVEQLLDVRKAESGTLKPKLKSRDIVEFTKNEVVHFDYAIKQKGIGLKVNCKLNKLVTSFDPMMISKVYFNVISNAIKFTSEGKIVINIDKVHKNDLDTFKDSAFNSFVKIEIIDTGVGMAEDKKNKIFERFYQDSQMEGKGYGIGLSHTKELIDAHQGYIEVDSAPNMGTTIRFFLPDIKDLKETVSKNNFSTEDFYIDETTKKTELHNGKRIWKTILILEDNADMRLYIKSELSNQYNVIEAADGVEGLKLAEIESPDLVVSDIMMPKMDGIQFCQQLKSKIETSHIPVILLTAKVDTETNYKGIKMGADSYISKPFEMDYLKIRIENLLRSREKLKWLFQNNPVLEPSKITVSSIDEKFLSSVIEAIEQGISDSKFNVKSLELKLGMSHANFYRKIKSLTGLSGKELLQNMRMKRAHQILSDNKNLRVAEVAYMVGFTNPKYFGECFKEKFGFAPSELIKNKNSTLHNNLSS